MFQQGVTLARRPRAWWLQALIGPAPYVWRMSAGTIGTTYIEPDMFSEPYAYGHLSYGYQKNRNPSDCTMIVPGTED
jgi:hypothetical protein